MASTSVAAMERPYVDSNKRWILESGAAFHVIRAENVMDKDKPGRLKPMSKPLAVNTANSSLYIDKYVETHVPSLRTTIDTVVTDSAPDVLSLGRLCREHGFSFEWRGYKT